MFNSERGEILFGLADDDVQPVMSRPAAGVAFPTFGAATRRINFYSSNQTFIQPSVFAKRNSKAFCSGAILEKSAH